MEMTHATMTAGSELSHELVNAHPWYLKGCGSDGNPWVIRIEHFPFCIGRHDDCNLRLSSSAVSRRHAELIEHDGGVYVREFGSTNGTFLNRNRINGAQRLQSGDLLHFGDQEFRIEWLEHGGHFVSDAPDMDSTCCVSAAQLPKGLLGHEAEFDQMLRRRAVLPHYQPIVRLSDQQLIGYELLGRCRFPGLPESPGPLFEIAHNLGRDIELSRLFRDVGIAQACSLQMEVNLYFNSLPSEIVLHQLKESLPTIRVMAPDLAMTMEIHEATVTDIQLMREIRAILSELNMGLAYDDFGAGHARLLELMDVPPDVLKFDIALIRDIHLRSARSRRVMQGLVEIATDLGISTLAEGIEIREELDSCREMGFDYAQGYYTGRPAPLTS